jgi:hypothetical protein
MRTWSVQVKSDEPVRPHALDERVLTSLAEALEADAGAFDADVVGELVYVGARFDVRAPDEAHAVEQARAIFLGALRRAAGVSNPSIRLQIDAREHLPA